MKYVDMQEVALDQQTVAFPGSGNCRGANPGGIVLGKILALALSGN
jgi:hypothetical protein